MKIRLLAVSLLFLRHFVAAAESDGSKALEARGNFTGGEISLFAELRSDAENGDSQAQYELSTRYFSGQNAPQNLNDSFNWALKAAEQGHTQAQYVVGEHFYFGIGIGQNHSNAVDWYQRAAGSGLAEAQFSLGVCYTTGQGVGKNQAEAAVCYRNAAKQGHVFANYNLTMLESFASRRRPNPETLRRAAEQNFAPAQYNFAVCLDSGFGVATDTKAAVGWYFKAALQGHTFAANNLGYCYVTGRGVRLNEKEGVKWFLFAANRGLAQAQFTVGTCYYFGGYQIGWNSEEGARWLRQAASQGHSEAVPLSKAVEIQRTVKPNPVLNPFLKEETRELLRKQMTQSQYRDAAHREAIRKANRPIMPDRYSIAITAFDYTQAVKTKPSPPLIKPLIDSLKARAQGGSADAQCELGVRFLKGDGVEDDRQQAVKWLKVAATNGNQKAERILKQLDQK